MGAKQSSQHKQLNESINKVSTNIVVSASSSASGSIKQVQDLVISGIRGSTVSGIQQIQNAKLSVKSVQDAVAGADLQNKLINGINSEIQKQKTDFPQLVGNIKSASEIRNVVKNSVSTNFSMSALSKLSMNISQKQKLAIIGITDDGLVKNISQQQAAEGIASQINKMSSSISNKLLGETTVASKTTDVTKFFGAEFVNALGGTFNDIIKNVGDFFGIDAQTTILIGIVLIALPFPKMRKVGWSASLSKLA